MMPTPSLDRDRIDTADRARGRLKIYLGYAAGVGKTYQMLEEGGELQRDGVDVAIGYFEPHGRKDTIAKTEGLEAIPRKAISYRDATFEEMDTAAILARKPRVCLVDELAHTNVPGSEREKRWQDVQVLLDSGIDVISTMNVQHIESLNDQIQQITGVRVRETVPDWVVNEAEEVVLVDITPRALRNRLERGVVYASEKSRQAMANFFTESNLGALRELALRQAAHEIEDRLEHSRAMPEPEIPASNAVAEVPRHQEKIMICLNGRSTSTILIRRGKRVADYLQADSVVVFVAPDAHWKGSAPETRELIQNHLKLAESLHMGTQVLYGSDVAGKLVEFARQQKVTQLLVGRSHKNRWQGFFQGSLIDRIIRIAPDLQITVVAHDLPSA